MSIYVGVLAGIGLTHESWACLRRLRDDVNVDKVFVVTTEDWPVDTSTYHSIPWYEGEPSNWSKFYFNIGEKITSRDMIYSGRENLRKIIAVNIKDDVNYIVMIDDDIWLSTNYFSYLSRIPYNNRPFLATGKTFNPDGSRYWDIGAFRDDGNPSGVPYSDAITDILYDYRRIYCSGAQWILNREAFSKGVKHRGACDGTDNEDVRFSWDCVDSGIQIKFFPNIYGIFLHQHNVMSRFPGDKCNDSIY